MNNLRIATTADKIGDIYIVFGTEISNNIIVTKDNEKYIFYLNNKRYVGSSIPMFKNIGDLLAYTYDKKWFKDQLKQTLIESKITPIDKDNIIIECCCYEKPIWH